MPAAVTHTRDARRVAAARFGLLAGVVAALTLTSGCANQHAQLVEFLHSDEQMLATGAYEVMPPDAIRILAPVSREIDRQVARVRPDGKVSLELLGDVQVAGLTPEQIADKIANLLTRYYTEPKVVVEVADYRSQVFHIFGEVYRPGPKPFTGRDTILAALSEAQPNFLAWKSQIRLTRPIRDGRKHTVVIDLDRMLREGDPQQDFLLQPGDVIEVPPTPLAWIGHRVREVFYPVQPAVDTYVAPSRAVDANDTYSNSNNRVSNTNTR